MAKASPQSIGQKPFRKIDRTFSDWTDHQFHCSCGIKFDGRYPERDPSQIELCPGIDPNAEQQETHVVTLQKPVFDFQVLFTILGQSAIFGVGTEVQELQTKYVTGWGVKGEPGYRVPLPLPPVAGRPVKPNLTTCGVAAFLVAAQLAPSGNPDDLYTAEEFLGFMLSDSICEQMYRTSIDVQTGGELESPLAPTQTA